jgi:glycine/D-amino acid oxidase-like deaminating enzyme
VSVVVVGGGIVGAATAYFLAREGIESTLLERHEVAWGASGRNPGYLWTQTRAEGIQLQLGLAGRALYDVLATELESFEFRPCGGMIYFFEEQADLFPKFVEERRRAGLPLELLTGDEARARCAILPPDVAGATFNPLDAHVHPGKTTQALALAAERLGATVSTGVEVTGLDATGGRVCGVRTRDGGVEADLVVVAAGAWSARLLEPLGIALPVVPMRLQMAETEPAPIRFDQVLYGPTGIKQYAFTKSLDGYTEEVFIHPLETVLLGAELLELAVQRTDGRVLLGCPMDFPGLDDRPTVGGVGLMLGVLGDHLPALRELAIERVWAGLLPQTPDALPILGPVDGVDGLWLATGHVFGMLAGPLSGKLIAQLIAGRKPDLDPSPFQYGRESVLKAAGELRTW